MSDRAGPRAPDTRPAFLLDGRPVPFDEGQSILAAALAAGTYVPYLCYHPDFAPHGSCKVCTVKVDGRTQASCTTPARAGAVVESDVDELSAHRLDLVQMLFTEGNHFCPGCEASGSCTLQAVAYELGMTSAHYSPLSPDRPLDASHPDAILDLDRCILCELCVRASALVDKKSVFALAGRGASKHLVVSAESGELGDTDFAASDKAMSVCPVGAILPKRRGFTVPIGRRRFDLHPVSDVSAARDEEP